ncbi:MAG: helix-turn-helix domain-containing protein [Pseudomonadota bacterium]
MTETTLKNRTPTDQEMKVASQAADLMAAALTQKGLPFSVTNEGEVHKVELTPSLGQLVLDVLTHIGRGQMVTVLPYDADLTTKEAADILNVSRPYFIKLLENKELPFRLVGTHRRVRADDLLAYKDKRDADREQAINDIQALGEELEAD